MNTKEFTNLVKEKGEFENNKKAQEAIKAVVDALTEVLSKKNDVSLASFGIFTTTLQKGSNRRQICTKVQSRKSFKRDC